MREKTSHVQRRERHFNECKKRRQHLMGKQRRQRRRRKKCADELANGIMLTNKKKDERERGVVGVCTIFYTGNCCLFSFVFNSVFLSINFFNDYLSYVHLLVSSQNSKKLTLKRTNFHRTKIGKNIHFQT